MDRCAAALSPGNHAWKRVTSLTMTRRVVRDEMTFLNAADKNWIMNQTIERVWPFGA